jgi:hypothetical protein
MVLVEYKLHKVSKNGKKAPDFIMDGGHWLSPIDNTMVGLVEAEADRDYYIPDTITSLSRAEFLSRQLTIHASVPMVSRDEEGTETTLTDAEVTEQAGTWYDSFVV